jgi:hypothetical protein
VSSDRRRVVSRPEARAGRAAAGSVCSLSPEALRPPSITLPVSAEDYTVGALLSPERAPSMTRSEVCAEVPKL